MPGLGGGLKLIPIETMEAALALAQSLLSQQFGVQPTNLAFQDFKRGA
jgi:hypothetical protein